MTSDRPEWNVPDISIPTRLAEFAARDRTGRQQEWLRALPQRVTEISQRWSLVVGEPFVPGGVAGWVAPARRGDADLVLKVGFLHYEAEHEADGLRVWSGAGAVRLFDSERTDDTQALLLERCIPGSALGDQSGRAQDEIVAGLLQRLWVVPTEPHPFRPLQKMCDDWADEFEQKRVQGRVTIDPGMARTGIELFRALPKSAEREVLLVTDLHAENVLAAQREPWLVIDPKPYVGDPTYDAVQHMLNRRDDLQSDPHALVLRMAGLCNLDADRLRLWLFARCVQQSPDWLELGPVAVKLAP